MTRPTDRVQTAQRAAPKVARATRGAVPNIALAATFHDPPGALAEMIARWLPAVAAQYRVVAVATSPPTAKRIVAMLFAHGAYAGTPAGNTRGPLYRLSIRQALASGAARVHYLDLDRALHWMLRAPRELRDVLALAERHPSLLIGRTLRAHRSHHGPLYVTETVTNAMFARRFGIAGRVDFLVPSFVVTRHGAMRLLARSRARDAQIYGEWTALLAGLERRLAYVECRGLDWETPDRHRRAVARFGLAAWRRRMETPDEWARRLAMAREFQRGFERALRRRPVRRPQVVRRTP